MSNKQIGVTIESIKRLQTFLPQEVIRGLKQLPTNLGKVTIKNERGRFVNYSTTKISITDKDAFKEFDTNKLAKAHPRLAKAVSILQKVDFDPDVIEEVTNYLPGGMVDMSVGSEVGISFNFNFNCKRSPSGHYWPTTIDDIERIENPLQTLQTIQPLQTLQTVQPLQLLQPASQPLKPIIK